MLMGKNLFNYHKICNAEFINVKSNFYKEFLNNPKKKTTTNHKLRPHLMMKITFRNHKWKKIT